MPKRRPTRERRRGPSYGRPRVMTRGNRQSPGGERSGRLRSRTASARIFRYAPACTYRQAQRRDGAWEIMDTGIDALETRMDKARSEAVQVPPRLEGIDRFLAGPGSCRRRLKVSGVRRFGSVAKLVAEAARQHIGCDLATCRGHACRRLSPDAAAVIPRSSAPVDTDLVGAFRTADRDVDLGADPLVGYTANSRQHSGNTGWTQLVTVFYFESTTAACAGQRLAYPIRLVLRPTVTVLYDLRHRLTPLPA